MSFGKKFGAQIVNDGITVAKEIELEDPGKHRRSTNSGSFKPKMWLGMVLLRQLSWLRR